MFNIFLIDRFIFEKPYLRIAIEEIIQGQIVTIISLTQTTMDKYYRTKKPVQITNSDMALKMT